MVHSSHKNVASHRVSLVTLVTNTLLAILKGVFGVIFGSAALVADAFHSVSDILSSGIVYFGIIVAKRPPDSTHHYGHGKLESVASKVVALILILTAIALGYNAISIFFETHYVPGRGAIIGAVISIVVKEILFRYNYSMGVKNNSSALKADALHNRSDAISSLAALLGILGARFGFLILDPIGALLVSVLILRMGIKLYLSSIRELIDTAPSNETLELISDIVKNTKGIQNVHDIKARYHGPKILVDMKVCVNRNSTVAEGHHFAGTAKHHILKDIPEIENVLIHVNPCQFDKQNCKECQKRERVDKNEQ
ncbi:cation diffusion facilitator family transporter [Natranaerobius trueperi]|nr:cation diffusion facilitator family transporter [Natranaerobius trueperi]